MVQQTVDAKSTESGLANAESNMSNRDKHFPVSVKKTALRDVQNEYRIPISFGNSPLLKDRGQMVDAVKTSGTKRALPEDSMDLLHSQFPGGHATNAQLVYVRRKSEVEIGKGASDGGNGTADCVSPRHLGLVEETAQPKPQVNQQKLPSFAAFAPMHASTTVTASGKPSIPLSLGQSSTRYAPADSDYLHAASSIPSLNNPWGMKDLHWEERYRRLQILLKKLDESYLEDYVHVLRSVSSVELSILAVELERRSIQLSLEEGKEMQRVAALNVLGKPPKAPSVSQAQANK